MRAALAALAVALGVALAACRAPLARFEHARPAMGTEFRVVLFARDEASARAAADAAFARIAELERALSDYDPQSELSLLGARSDALAPTEPIALSRDLARVLAAAEDVARASGGAFDATVGPYSRLWRRARRRGEPPSDAELAAAAGAVGFERLELDREAGSARLLARGMRLDLGGIAKGFALDEALRVLERGGHPRALVVGGGDVRAGEPPPGERGWRVALAGLDAPRGGGETLELARAALSTSGDLEQFLELEGVRHSHVLDPRTGRALTERRLASVLAPSATLSDALATALCVLGPEEGLALAERLGAEARVELLREDAKELRATSGFPPLSFVAPSAHP